MPRIIGLPKVRFNLFDWNAKEETYIILYYQYLKGQRLKFSTGWKIFVNDWDRQKQRARHTKRFADSTFLNAYLDNLERVCTEIYLENRKGNISPEDFRLELKKRMGEENEDSAPGDLPSPPTFLEFIEDYCQERSLQPNIKASTLRALVKVKNNLLKYANERKNKLNFSELDDKFFADLRNWLHAAPRLHNTNTVQKTLSTVKSFARLAESRGHQVNQAYQFFKLPKKTQVSKIALSFEQLEQLHALDLSVNAPLKRVRDLFLIGAYTGLRFSDFTRIRPEHIQDHRGQRVIEITTQKTDQTVYIPLHPVLDDVLKKYGYSSPSISNQKMNDYLKELGKMAGFNDEKVVNDATGGIRREKTVQLWEMLTTHVARRSFATNYYQKHPELIDNIMKITGHSTERMFRAYIVTDALDSALDFGDAISKPNN
jgi:integrase